VKKIVFYIAVSLALFVVSCDMDLSDSGQYFEYDLRGTWRSTEPYFPNGELIIEYSRITVKGYNAYWSPDNALKNITSGIPLEGYSIKGEVIDKTKKEGEIFIYDRGSLQEGIPYTYWEGAYDYDNYVRPRMLTFYYGESHVTLKYSGENN
jgi:hypothetical protein